MMSDFGANIKLVSPVYAHKLCRCCLCEVHKDYFWLESYYLEKKIIDIYKNVTSVEIEVNDCLPKKLCTTCYDHIIKFDLFKTKALNSEKILAEQDFSESIQIIVDETENKTEHIANTDNTFEYIEVIGCVNGDTDSEDEISEKTELAEKDGTQKEHSECKYTETAQPTECYDSQVPNVLQVVPKAKFKKRTNKIYKEDISNNGLEEKQKRERKKEACKECGKVLFAYKMENHMRTHTKEKPYGCEKCGARFSEKSNLNRHVKTHGNDRPYTCNICLKGFLRPSSRAMHEVTAHRSEKNVLCSMCGKGFKHQYFLNKHMTNIHKRTEVYGTVEGSGYPCPICGNFYRTKSSLNVHKMKHEQPRSFLCNICGNAYSTKAVLENHQKVHTGEKNCSCPICNKKFRFISTLKTHILVHSGEKPLSCPVCNKHFRQHSHLNTHIRGQHSSIRPYQCSFCSKTFKQSCNLTVHTRIHTGETPFHCDICEKGFYDSSSMRKHKKSHLDKNSLPDGWDKTELNINRMENHALQT